MAVRSVALKKQQPAFENDQQLFDTHPEVRLDFDRVRDALQQGYTKPFLLVDPTIVRTKARRFKAAMPRVQPHYAVKANPHPTVLRTLIEEGVGFEIASIAELDLLLELGVPAAEIYYSNPVKSRAYLEYAAAKGVQWYVLDCVEELRKNCDEVVCLSSPEAFLAISQFYEDFVPVEDEEVCQVLSSLAAAR